MWIGGLLLISSLILGLFTWVKLPPRASWPRPMPITCVNNLKQIGLGFLGWSLEHQGKFPFNVSTNQGGVLELCRPDSQGFEQNPVVVYKVLSNELANPAVLLCPDDHTRMPPVSFELLVASNVTYKLHSGEKLSPENVSGKLMSCPIHNNALTCDGRVIEGQNNLIPQGATLIHLFRFSSSFRTKSLASLLLFVLGTCLFVAGLRLRAQSS